MYSHEGSQQVCITHSYLKECSLSLVLDIANDNILGQRASRSVEETTLAHVQIRSSFLFQHQGSIPGTLSLNCISGLFYGLLQGLTKFPWIVLTHSAGQADLKLDSVICFFQLPK